jgi:hypothetical protein
MFCEERSSQTSLDESILAEVTVRADLFPSQKFCAQLIAVA